MEKEMIFQATQTVYKGLAWDFSNGMVSHILEGSNKTACGKNCKGGSSYGWVSKTNSKQVVFCPICQKEHKVYDL